jgi:lipid-A-disaccharide synthase-like uncharacterized protein
MNSLVGHFSGNSWIEFWTAVGWVGAVAFGSRFYVQWYATEKKGQVVVPAAFWWLSLVGSLLLLAYAIFYDKHHVIIIMYLFSWIPYLRNLVIHYRHEKAHTGCPGCGKKVPPQSNFCPHCGAKLSAVTLEP